MESAILFALSSDVPALISMFDAHWPELRADYFTILDSFPESVNPGVYGEILPPGEIKNHDDLVTREMEAKIKSWQVSPKIKIDQIRFRENGSRRVI